MPRHLEPSDGTVQSPDAKRAMHDRRDRPRRGSTRRDDRSRRHRAVRYAKKLQEPLHNRVRKNLNPVNLRKVSPARDPAPAESPASLAADAPPSGAETHAGFCGDPERQMGFSEEAAGQSAQNPMAQEELEDGSKMEVEETGDLPVQVDMDKFYGALREYLQVEAKFQPNLVLPTKPQHGEISAGTRDGAVHVLRCLKVWYDLPPDVLFHAINLLDRFLTKMKVRSCHMSCISVSCMKIAIVSHRPELPLINTEDLVTISQCKCTAGDVGRMSAVIGEKLGAIGGSVTALQWLRLLCGLFSWHLQESELVNWLEILSCDASCCNIRACELALVLICTQLDSQLSAIQRASPGIPPPQRLLRLVDLALELQRLCQIGDESFYASHQAVVGVLERYNARQKTPHRQRLVWRLSSRTLKVLRPTDKLTSMLPTIEEQNSTPLTSDNMRSRSGSECSDDLNEDTKDWPTSPLVPVLCTDN